MPRSAWDSTVLSHNCFHSEDAITRFACSVQGTVDSAAAANTQLLSELTTLRLGGPAGELIAAHDEQAVLEVCRRARRESSSLLALGGGSNLVVCDEGFDGLVLQIATGGILRECQRDGRMTLTVAAGESWGTLVEDCVANGFAGIEALAGIPGSVGATPVQNVGAYGQEVSQVIHSVRVLDRERDEVRVLSGQACRFGYRRSLFKRDRHRYVVLSVRMTLKRSRQSGPLKNEELCRRLGVALDETAPIGLVRDAVLDLRRGKGMVLDPEDHDTWSVGSFFLNPVLAPPRFEALQEQVKALLDEDTTVPHRVLKDESVSPAAAWLIDRAGFQPGYPLMFDPAAGVALSWKHTLALTNRGHGSTTELMALAKEIAKGVRRVFEVELVPEPVLVGESWSTGVPPG